MTGRAERRPRWSLGLGGVDWRRKRDPGAGQFAAEDPQISSMSRCLEGEKNGVCDHSKGASRTLED